MKKYVCVREADGRLTQLKPRMAAIVSLLLDAEQQILVQRQGWIEIHFDGPKVDARLKGHLGTTRTDERVPSSTNAPPSDPDYGL